MKMIKETDSEDRLLEIMHSEEEKNYFFELIDPPGQVQHFKRSNICVFGVPKGKEREEWDRKL